MKPNDIYFRTDENIIHATPSYVAINGVKFHGASVESSTKRGKGEDEIVIKFKGRMI